MKILICLLLVTVLACARTALIEDVSRYLNAGNIQRGDKQLHRSYLYKEAIPDSRQYQDLIYNGDFRTRISAVQAFEVGDSQYASAWILQDGIGTNNVTVRVQSAPGNGYYFKITIWGRQYIE